MPLDATSPEPSVRADDVKHRTRIAQLINWRPIRRFDVIVKLSPAENLEMTSFMKVAMFAAVATAALHHGPPRLSPRARLGRAPPVVLTAKKRTFEFCSVDDAGEIESCELVTSQVS